MLGSCRSTELRWALTEWSAAAAHRGTKLALATCAAASWRSQKHRRTFNSWAAGTERAATGVALKTRACARARTGARRAALSFWRAFLEAIGQQRERQDACGTALAFRRKLLGLRRWKPRVIQRVLTQRAAGLRARLRRHSLEHASLRWLTWVTVQQEDRGRLRACATSYDARRALVAMWRWRRWSAQRLIGLRLMRRAVTVHTSNSKLLALRRLMGWWQLASATARLRRRVGWRQWILQLLHAHMHAKRDMLRERELGSRRSKRRTSSQRRVFERWSGRLRAHRQWCALVDEVGRALRRYRRRCGVLQWAGVAIACRRQQRELDCRADTNWTAASVRVGWRGWQIAIRRARQLVRGVVSAASFAQRRLLWRWVAMKAARHASHQRSLTARRRRHRSGCRTAMSRWRRAAHAAREPRAAAEHASVFRARNMRQALRRWASVARTETARERLLHAREVISSLADEVREVKREAEVQAAQTGVEVDCLRDECAGLRRALAVPSYRRPTVASRRHAISMGDTIASPLPERPPKPTSLSGLTLQGGFTGLTRSHDYRVARAPPSSHIHVSPPAPRSPAWSFCSPVRSQTLACATCAMRTGQVVCDVCKTPQRLV